MENEQKRREIIEDEEDSEINKLLFSIMEGYTDKLISPLSQFTPLKEDVEEEDLPSSAAAASTAATIGRRMSKEKTETLKKERDRRSKMAESFDLLLSMLPNPYPKATRETVVSETIEYIQSLEKEIAKLENQLKKKKNESRPAKANHQTMNYHRFSEMNSSCINVTVSSNNVAFFGIQSPVRPRVLTNIFTVFDNHKAEILAANVTVNQRELRLTVTATVFNGNIDCTIEKIKRDLLLIL